MRCASAALTGGLSLLLAGALCAQTVPVTPPAGAHDITAMPDQQPAVSATIAPPASVVRVYVGNLTGADAAAIGGLITQALFQSKQVVVTTNQSNASLVLQGSVLREAIPAENDASTAHRGAHKGGASSRKNTAQAPATATSPFGDNMPVTELPPVGNGSGAGDAGASDGSAIGSANLGLGMDASANLLSDFGGMDSAADLSHYRYRLNLELLNPSGDLLWMSGQGNQALPFQDADDAVTRTMQPLLDAIKQMTPVNASTNPSSTPH